MNRTLASIAIWLACLGGWPQASLAQTPPTVAPASDSILKLADILMIGPVIDILRDEGLEYGKTVEVQMFAGRGGPRWEAAVARVYDTNRMRKLFDTEFAAELANDADSVQGATEFFGTDLGQRILSLETEARRTLMDDAAEDAALLRFEEMDASDDPRLRAIRRFAEVNDLVESNVVGALNSNLAFYQGMADAGAFAGAMTEEDMLADVWGQEEGVRAETEQWLYPYLTLAYSSLSDDELAAYVAFSETPAGKRVNTAMFAAFDKLFVAISRDLGRAAARQMQGEDI